MSIFILIDLFFFVDNIKVKKISKLYSPKSSIVFSNYSGVYSNRNLNLNINDNRADKMCLIYNDDTSFFNKNNFEISISSYPLKLSKIPTSSKNYKKYANSWSEPIGEFSSFHQIKVLSYFENSILDSAKENYVLGSLEFDSLPIVNLNVNQNWLFSNDSGCYVPGVNFDNSNDQNTGNFYSFKKRKQVGKIQIIDRYSEYLNGDYLFRIHGYITPLAPQKGLRFYLNEKTAVNKLFDVNHTIDKLILRSSFSGWGNEIFIDGWIADICSTLNLDVMAYKPSKVYLNGEYWGIHGIRERLDLKAIANKYDLKEKKLIDSDDKGYSKNNGYGTINDLILKIKESPNISFKEIKDRFKLKSLLDWLIVELFFQNVDWPCNNTFFWKKNKSNKKWKAVLIDMDACVGSPEKNMFEFATKDRSPALGGVLVTYLLKQPEFKEKFKERVKYLFDNELSSENLLKKFNYYKTFINPAIEEHYRRWGDPDGVYKYNKGLKRIKDFCLYRHKYFILNMNNYFN